jgi:polysaccharide biosynthesis protein PslG
MNRRPGPRPEPSDGRGATAIIWVAVVAALLAGLIMSVGQKPSRQVASTPVPVAVPPAAGRSDAVIPPAATVPLSPSTSSPTTTPYVAPGVPVGMNLGSDNRILEDESPVGQEATLSAIRASGVTEIRFDVSFVSVEPSPGVFQWPMVPTINQTIQAGLSVDALLDYPPTWAQTQDGSPQPAAFASFAQRVAAKLGPLGISVFEIENEENRVRTGDVNVAGYAALLEDSYAAIKAVDPHSTVLVGGLADASDDAGPKQMSSYTFLEDLYADRAEGSFDGVAVHPYSAPVLPMYPASWNNFYNLPHLHSIMASHGDGSKSIWITEFGAPTRGPSYSVSPAAQAEAVTQAYDQVQKWPWVAAIYYFEWQDDPVDGGWWGLSTESGQRKPALAALRRLLTKTVDDGGPVPSLGS